MRRIALTALGFALLLSAVPLFSQTNATIEKTLRVMKSWLASVERP